MSKSLALVLLLLGIFVVIPALVYMTIAGLHHVFSPRGGALYYGFIAVMGAVDAFTIPSVWGVLADD